MTTANQRLMVSKKIKQVLRFCEENYEKGNLETALRCAVSIAIANPNTPEPYAHVTAYRILLTAQNNRTITGEPDWYAVFGIKRCGSSSESVEKSIVRRSYEIMDLLNGEDGAFKAGCVIYELLGRGIAELKNEESRRAYDQRSGFYPSYRLL